MSKTHTIRKNNVTKMSTGHFSDDRAAEDTGAPVGLERTSAAQVSGPTVFDVVSDLSSVGQITVLRAVANSAIVVAVFAAHDWLIYDGPREDNGALSAAQLDALERWEQAGVRMGRQAELYSYAATELGTLAQSPFDQPMSLEQALDFAVNTAAERKPDELPDEVVEALGLTHEQVKLIDAVEQQKAAKRSSQLRESIRDNRDGIAAELASFVGAHSEDVVNQLDANQHQALLRKAVQKSQARLGQLVGMRSRYSAALGEAMLLSADVKTLDKAFVAFTRANIGELRDAA